MMAGFGTNGGATCGSQQFTCLKNSGATVTSRDSYWFQSYWILGPGNHLLFGSPYFNSPASSFYVYFVVEPGAGTFKLQFSTNSNPAFGDLLTVDASSTAIAGAVTNVVLPLGYYNMRVLGVTGHVRLIQAGRQHPSSTGLTPFCLGEPGWCTTNFTYANSNVVLGILTNIHPKLLLTEMKDVNRDESTNTFATNFLSFYTLLTNCFPYSDRVFVGTTPTSPTDISQFGPENNGVLWQNQFIRSNCITLREAYWDGYSPFGDFASAANHGWYVDDKHPSTAGSKHRAEIFTRDIGLNKVPKFQQGVAIWNRNGMQFEMLGD